MYLPQLENTYTRGTLRSVDFENYIKDDKLELTEAIFRPVPETLQRVQQLITTTLFSAGRLLTWAAPEALVYQGEYIWPPLSENADGLDMHLGLRHKFRNAVSQQLEKQKGAYPRVYKLKMFTREGWRNILMTRVPVGPYTNLPQAKDYSEFWLLHEAVEPVAGQDKPKLSLLGGMFLPKLASTELEAAGLIYPVGTNFVRNVRGR